MGIILSDICGWPVWSLPAPVEAGGFTYRCIDCGGPRSFGSAMRCKSCYERRTLGREITLQEYRERAGLAVVEPVADFLDSDEGEKPARPKVTRSNYREVARGFDSEQLKNLARLLKRHDPKACDECTAPKLRRRCNFLMEAVEAVVMGFGGAEVERDDYPATDYNRVTYRAAADF